MKSSPLHASKTSSLHVQSVERQSDPRSSKPARSQWWFGSEMSCRSDTQTPLISNTPWDCHICRLIEPPKKPLQCRHIWHTWSVWARSCCMGICTSNSSIPGAFLRVRFGFITPHVGPSTIHLSRHHLPILKARQKPIELQHFPSQGAA